MRASRVFSPSGDELVVDEARQRHRVSPASREKAARAGAAFGLICVSALLIGLGETPGPEQWLAIGMLTLVFAIASMIEFEAGPGSAVPTQLAFVPMLYFVPAAFIPLCVAAGFVLGVGPALARGRFPADRLLGLAGSAWFAVGSALAIVAFRPPEPTLADVGWLGALVAIQVGTELATTTTREYAALGSRPDSLLRPIAWASMVDILLTPVAVATVISTGGWYAGLVTLPLLALLSVFARERRARMDNAIELSTAYRGTAYLLGDVVEADDAYTGMHSRDVLELTLAVCDRLGMSSTERRRAEFTALLHDVGKIRIPPEIINKAGPLDENEWALMKTHTVEGERMLNGVGGLLGDVGSLVRSCHERIDGAGYPDGLEGDEIPLISRVVMACDAYNAMVTDRSYRAARGSSEAVAELYAHAGTQFDSNVVDAIAAVVE